MLIARLKNLMVLDIQMILFKQSYLFHDEHNHQQLDLIVVIRFSFKELGFLLNRLKQSYLFHDEHNHQQLELIVVIRFSFKVMDFHLNRFEQSCLSRVCHI